MFQGSIQACAGFTEACIGGTMTFATGGAGASLGWFIMTHGIDQFLEGVQTAIISYNE
ncbi:MAG: hypothetical protein V4494_04330 [Chlamydiota bacterium]